MLPLCINAQTIKRPTSIDTVIRPINPGMTLNVRMGTTTDTAMAVANAGKAEVGTLRSGFDSPDRFAVSGEEEFGDNVCDGDDNSEDEATDDDE